MRWIGQKGHRRDVDVVGPITTDSSLRWLVYLAGVLRGAFRTERDAATFANSIAGVSDAVGTKHPLKVAWHGPEDGAQG